MHFRLPLVALVGLFACAASDDDPAALTDGSSGEARTQSDGGTTAAAGGTLGGTSTDGVGTGEATTADPPTSTGPTSEADETAAGPSTRGSSPPGSSSSEAAESSTTGDGNDDRPRADCVELEACCDQIGADLYSGCITVVQMGSTPLCSSILTTYHQEGYCTGESFCADLGGCCSELPPGVGWQDTCEYYADLGNQPQCAMLIGDYQLSGYCE